MVILKHPCLFWCFQRWKIVRLLEAPPSPLICLTWDGPSWHGQVLWHKDLDIYESLWQTSLKHILRGVWHVCFILLPALAQALALSNCICAALASLIWIGHPQWKLLPLPLHLPSLPLGSPSRLCIGHHGSRWLSTPRFANSLSLQYSPRDFLGRGIGQKCPLTP